MLGIQDMGATTMFANLYVFSGSNHLMAVPTGVLFSRVPELDGGVVRVDWTDSAHFNNIHPHEKTKVRVRKPRGRAPYVHRGSALTARAWNPKMHTPRLTRWLRDIGHTSRQFGPYSARIVGAYAKVNGAGGDFEKYEYDDARRAPGSHGSRVSLARV